MSEGMTQMEDGYTHKEGEKLRLLTLDDLDGRTLASKCLRELESQITADLGGDLTAAQRALLHHASSLNAMLEDRVAGWVIGAPFTLGEFSSGLNTFNRVLSTLGLERKPKPVNGSPLLLG